MLRLRRTTCWPAACRANASNNFQKERPMTMSKSLIVSGAVIGFISCVPTSANAEPRASLNIADHDGIYVDGRSFKVIPGTASGDGSALMRKSGVRELGP